MTSGTIAIVPRTASPAGVCAAPTSHTSALRINVNVTSATTGNSSGMSTITFLPTPSVRLTVLASNRCAVATTSTATEVATIPATIAHGQESPSCMATKA